MPSSTAELESDAEQEALARIIRQRSAVLEEALVTQLDHLGEVLQTRVNRQLEVLQESLTAMFQDLGAALG
jgi:hypothetical protein